jgi:hypothetical protein
MFLFFSVARSASTDQAERAIEVPRSKPSHTHKVVSDKWVDVTPQALCMSSPFNTSYWLAVA